uniref:Gonadoliberin n=1 Tax=Felis catus TaxID=9685 RepID=A0ABI7XWX9_FELCA
MAGCRLGLLLLLLLTAHPGRSKAQHWSRGWYPRGKRASSSAQHPQHVPRLPGRVLGTAASRPDKAAHNLPSDALAPLRTVCPGRPEPQAGATASSSLSRPLPCPPALRPYPARGLEGRGPGPPAGGTRGGS